MSEAQDKLNVVTGFLGKNEEPEPPVLVEVSLMPPDSLTDLFSHRPVAISNESQSQYRTWNTSYNSIEDTELERGSDDLVSSLQKIVEINATIEYEEHKPVLIFQFQF